MIPRKLKKLAIHKPVLINIVKRGMAARLSGKR